MVSKITVPVIFTQKVIKVTRDCPILQHSFWNKKMGTYTGDKGFALLTLLLTSHTQFKTRFNSLAIDILKCLRDANRDLENLRPVSQCLENMLLSLQNIHESLKNLCLA